MPRPRGQMMPLLAARFDSVVRQERGQTLAEYALILALIAVGVVVPTVLIFRGELAAGFDAVSICLLGGCPP